MTRNPFTKSTPLRKGFGKFSGVALAGAAGGLFWVVAFWGWSVLVEPKAIPEMTPARADEIERVTQARKLEWDPANPPVFVKEVDYSEGPSASWWPKEEAPLLTDLVERGILPPVAERVGSEPLVIDGPDGPGNYGGTLNRLVSVMGETFVWQMGRVSPPGLVRFSPMGYPVVPHLAKDWEVLDGGKRFIFHLRKGVRWSDGHPFTADDIVFAYEVDYLDPEFARGTEKLAIKGTMGKVEKIDEYTVQFTFEHPFGLFPEILACGGDTFCTRPRHYLEKYHPTRGDQQAIEEAMKELGLRGTVATFNTLRSPDNPDLPSLSPWIHRTRQTSPPYQFVRNPYYFAVDAEGKQLPYVDRVLVSMKHAKLHAVALMSGEASLHWNTVANPTQLIQQQESGDYQVRYWKPDFSSAYMICPNLNRAIDPDDPSTEKRRELLNDVRFRKALSLSIDRQELAMRANGWDLQPSQNAPGPDSPFHFPELYHAFTEHDLEAANQLLDEMGLTQRDREGFRTFRDGSRMTIFLESGWDLGEAHQILTSNWADAGIRVSYQERSLRLFWTIQSSYNYDLGVAVPMGDFSSLFQARNLIPISKVCNFAPAWGRWYEAGGFHGAPVDERIEEHAIPEGHPLREALQAYDSFRSATDLETRVKNFRRIQEIALDNVWTIGTTTLPPNINVVKNGLRNVPDLATFSFSIGSPGNTAVESVYWEDPIQLSPLAREEILQILSNSASTATVLAKEEKTGLSKAGHLLRWLVIGIIGLLIISAAIRHPYITHRLMLVPPTLLVMSVIAFVAIQLPPGDFLTAKMAELEESGTAGELQEIEELREIFHLDEPMIQRYARWLGLYWFITFDKRDTGLLQFNLGRSMDKGIPVNDLVGDRIALTMFISFSSILFTWVVAMPIGILSAVRQYSIWDYIFTLIGFIGMAIPNFLLAILIMYFSGKYLGINVTGLFSPEYLGQPEWTWGKFIDLLKHVWVPVIIIGTSGTAGMIRIMRANLLDELRKPYVTTARAKGMRPLRLLLKYPVRLALNPFISGIGGIFPALVSGGAIVAIILGLPTVSPLMLDALMLEDVYLAGSMLLVLSLLGIFGTLVSDLLLLALDPRIRFEGGKK